MKTSIESREARAGITGLLALAIGYLYATGLSNAFRVWAFMVLAAVCLVLMMKSLVDLFVYVFSLASVCSGKELGRAMRLMRRV